MEKVSFYFDEAGEKGFLAGKFLPRAFGLVAGIALPTRNVTNMNQDLQDIFKELDCSGVEKIRASEIFKKGANKKVYKQFISYMASQQEWLLVYEAIYPSGYLNFNRKNSQQDQPENQRYTRGNNPKKERLYNHLLEGVMIKLDEICKIENSSDLTMISDHIDKGLIKEAFAKLNYLKQEEHISTLSAFDSVEKQIVFKTITSKVEGFNLAIKNIRSIQIEETPSFLTLAADILTNALYRHLTNKISKHGSVRLHSHNAVDGFELKSKIAFTDDNYIMDSLYSVMIFRTDSIKFFERDNVSIAIGPNGCGKSYWLRQKAETTKDKVIAIATSTEHKLGGISSKRIKVLSPRSINYHPNYLLHKILLSLRVNDGKFRYAIGNILRYIGYDAKIIIDTSDFQNINPMYGKEHTPQMSEALFGLNKFRKDRNKAIISLDLDDSISEDFSDYYKVIKNNRGELPYYDFFHDCTYFLLKNNEYIPFKDCSSGELQLFRTLTYIHSNISDGSMILVDEPENSLHPKWQFEYVKNLLDTTHMYNPQVYLATHSPIIIDGLINQSNESNNEPIEALLYDYFDVITPKSYQLNEIIGDLLDKFARGTESFGNIVENLTILKEKVKTREQFEIITKVIEGVVRANKVDSNR